MIRDLHILARQVVIDFLQANPPPGALFWSVRDISRRYAISEYTAYGILKILSYEGYLERLPQRRACLKEHVNLALLGILPGNVRPAFIWPFWKTDAKGNFIADFSHEIKNICRQIHQQPLFLDNPSSWADPSLELRIKAASCNAVIAVSPPLESLILFTKLRAENLPIVVLGMPYPGYDDLDIHTLAGETKEFMRLLMLKWKSLGVRSPLVVSYGDSTFWHEQHVQGLKAAFPEVPDVETAGFFSNGGGVYVKIRELDLKLRSRRPPDALFFTDCSSLALALEMIPSLANRIKNHLFTAVFDDTGYTDQLTDLPIIAVKLQAKVMAVKAMLMIQKLRNGVRIPRRTFVRRKCTCPESLPVHPGPVSRKKLADAL